MKSASMVMLPGWKPSPVPSGDVFHPFREYPVLDIAADWITVPDPIVRPFIELGSSPTISRVVAKLME